MTPLPADRQIGVSGWAGNARVVSYGYRPTDVDGIRAVFALARERGLHVGLRGAGMSYGDASLAGEHVSLDLTRMNRIIAWNPETGVLTAEPGVTIQQVWEHAIEDGWWPAVVSGTMRPTLGGALAANIHGKNHWRAGTLGEHVTELDFLTASGEVLRLRPEGETSDLFHAAIGSFGTLGVFTSVTLRLRRVHSGLLRTARYSARDLAEMFGVFQARLPHADYLVGWVDAFATGRSLGRGLIEEANHLGPGDDPHPARTLRVSYQTLPDTVFGWFPKSALWRVARPWTNPFGVRLANAAQYALGARGDGKQGFDTYAGVNFKLDYVPDWKRAYGRRGLLQYQVFVPDGSAERTFGRLLTLCQNRGLPPFLAVFKRHRPDPFLLSYGGDGWSLALDFPVTDRERLWDLAAEMDAITLDAGGRHYFAKDSTLHRSRLAAYLAEPRVQKFLALKRELDPENLLQTDLYRRLFAADAKDTKATSSR
jgi:decaprenylphospho-beta-D-ribofuranose 2-oxidase